MSTIDMLDRNRGR